MTLNHSRPGCKCLHKNGSEQFRHWLLIRKSSNITSGRLCKYPKSLCGQLLLRWFEALQSERPCLQCVLQMCEAESEEIRPLQIRQRSDVSSTVDQLSSRQCHKIKGSLPQPRDTCTWSCFTAHRSVVTPVVTGVPSMDIQHPSPLIIEMHK